MFFKNNRKLHAVFVSVLTISILAIVKQLTSVDCAALFTFSNESKLYILAAVVIWVIGFVIYFKTILHLDVRIFFITLTLISSIEICKNIVLNFDSEQHDLKERICEKSIDDGMLCEMTNLSKQEYDYVMQDQLNLAIPTQANNISVYYYRDTFFGEYILSMSLEMPSHQRIDSLSYPNWTFSDSLKNKNIKYSYYDSRD